jgi:predicted DNA-binding protein (MmcQ/YjbR family)
VDQARHGVKDLALGLPGAWEDHPFGDGSTCVAKVGPKIFAFLSESRPHHVMLKVDPDRGEALRAVHPAAATDPPYLNKRHWVRLALDGTVDPDEVEDLLDASYELVLRSLTKAQREQAVTGKGATEKAHDDAGRTGQNRTDAKVPTRRKPTRS